MDLITTAQKFSANPHACSAEEIALLARDFHLAAPNIEAVLAVGNAHKTRWDGLMGEIKRAHFERQHRDALIKNPFATPEEIRAMPQPSEVANLSQRELGEMIFGK